MRITLRRRFALAVGALTTVAVLVFAILSWIATAFAVRDSIDDDLVATANLIEETIDHEMSSQNLDIDDLDDLEPFPARAEGDGRPASGPAWSLVQVLSNEGTAIVGDQLPISVEAMAVAQGVDAGPVLERAERADGTRIRIATVASERNAAADGQSLGAVQLAYDMSGIETGLRRARVFALLAALVSGVVAAGLASAFSGRLVAPVRAVADAADRLRARTQLPDRLAGEGPDEMGRLVTSFNALLDDLRASEVKQRQLVADASHELGTPLTTLRVNTEFLQSTPDLDEDDRQRIIDSSANQLVALSRLVDELVTLAAYGAPNEEIPRLINLGDLVRAEALDIAARTGRDIDVDVDDQLVETRPHQVRRAVGNLVGNATKYSPEDSPIRVTQRGPRIEVRDHGPGIAADQRERVFDRFYRGAAHQHIEGSGLGLAIVASIAAANGGTHWVTDPPSGPGVIVGFSVGPTASEPSAAPS